MKIPSKLPTIIPAICVALIELAVSFPAHTQSDTLLVRPDFQNWLFDPRAEIPAVPGLVQGPAVTLVSGGVWESGKPGTPSDGQIELLQALIGQPFAPGAFWYLAPAPLPDQSRFRDERLTAYSAIDSAGVYRNHYTVLAEQRDAEYAAYLRSTNQPGLSLRLTDGRSGAVIKNGQTVLGNEAEVLLTFTWPASLEDTLRVGGVSARQTAQYELALYPVLRPGQVWAGNLTQSDRVQTNRAGGVGSGRWTYDDYLLQGVRAGEQITFRVEDADFVPFMEIRSVAHEEVQASHDFLGARNSTFTVGGVPEVGARVYLIRVTSRLSGQLGRYRVSASRSPQIVDFSPKSGPPGTWVTVRGLNFLEGDSPLVTGVFFGAFEAGSTVPRSIAGVEEFDAFVPPEAVTGPITVTNAVLGVGSVSSSPFVVFSAIGAVRREASRGISFAISNAAPGMRHIVEATGDLLPPIQWSSVTNYTASTPGTWRYTNANSGAIGQRFFRVRRE